MFRIVVQDSRQTPTSGKVVAALGSFDPHTKTVTLDKEKAALYLKNGAQPSDRTMRILAAEGVVLPEWAQASANKTRTTRNPEKRRSTTPAAPAPAPEEPAAEAEPVAATAEPEEAPTPAAEAKA
jgi:small subunit ribosomal protein S16